MPRYPKGVTPQVRFFRSFEIAATGCWLWSGHKWTPKNPKDLVYGYIKVVDKRIQAHRFSYVLHKGEIKPGMVVRHTCDVPLCVNPDHLVQGTQLENVRDCVSKKRNACGSRSPAAKLTEAMVKEIRALYIPYDRTFSGDALARRFGVTPSIVHGILGGRRWKHVHA